MSEQILWNYRSFRDFVAKSGCISAVFKFLFFFFFFTYVQPRLFIFPIFFLNFFSHFFLSLIGATMLFGLYSDLDKWIYAGKKPNRSYIIFLLYPDRLLLTLVPAQNLFCAMRRKSISADAAITMADGRRNTN